MNYPIVRITTTDKLILFGQLLERESPGNVALLFIHGTASNFYCEDFLPALTNLLLAKNIAVLLANNRGAGIGESWQNTGAAVEQFESCIIDIDGWLDFLISKGYKKIILCGHSLGTEKVVYYMSKGKYVDKVSAVILLGFSDSFGTHCEFLKTQNIDPMSEALELIKTRKGHQYLTSIWLAHAGVLPQAATSYVNFFSNNSELSKAFPLRQGGNLEFYQKINVPILGLIGDGEEYTVIPTDVAVELLRNENKNAKVYKLENSGHSFEGAEARMAEMISEFLLHKLSV